MRCGGIGRLSAGDMYPGRVLNGRFSGNSGGERPAFGDALDRFGIRHEHARAPGHDLDGASHAPERRQVGVGRSLDLAPVAAHPPAPACRTAPGRLAELLPAQGASAGPAGNAARGKSQEAGGEPGRAVSAEAPALGREDPADDLGRVIDRGVGCPVLVVLPELAVEPARQAGQRLRYSRLALSVIEWKAGL